MSKFILRLAAGFLSVVGLLVGSVPAFALTGASVSSTLSSANISPGGKTTVIVTVTNPNNALLGVIGDFTTLPTGVSFASPNNLSSNCPASAAPNPNFGGNNLQITGSSFGPTTFQLAANASCTYQVDVTAPSVGTFSVFTNYANTTIFPANTSLSGTNSTSVSLLVGTPPVVTSISPTNGPTTGGTTVIISGSSFDATAANDIVKFGTTSANVTAASTTSLTVTSPVVSAGPVDISVSTSGGTSVTSSADVFTYLAPTVVCPTQSKTMTIGGASLTTTNLTTTCNDSSGYGLFLSSGDVATQAGNLSNELTIDCSSIYSPACDGTPQTVTTTNATYAFVWDNINNSADTYTITLISVGHNASPNVTSSANLSGLAGTDSFTFYTADAIFGPHPVPFAITIPAIPTVTSISPTSGTTAGGTSVVITGTNFTGTIGASGVQFGATNATSYTVNSSTQITATAPAGTGTVDVTVTNSGVTSATSAADQYTYITTPTVTSISPTSGPTAGGTSVVITGTNFTGATAVAFGATNAASFTVNSATQITATSPAGTGTVDLTVTTAVGTSPTGAADQYTYVAAPTVIGLSPSSGSASGATNLIITGTNFTGATAVTFGATSATSFTVNSATSITATSPAGSGTVDARVTTIGGSSATSLGDQFTYLAAPSIASAFNPTTILVSGSSNLTFTISNSNSKSLSGLSFTDNLPAGLVVSTPNGLSNTCGGSVTATAGTGSISLASGALAASGSCQITVSVAATSLGTKNNSVTVSDATAGTGNTSIATLTVNPLAAPSIATAFGTSPITIGQATTLTFTITNTNALALSGVSFNDTLPAGLVVSTPNGLTDACGGTVTATAGTGAISLATGTIAANSSCIITVSVTGATQGTKNNSVTVSDTIAGTGNTSNASIIVNPLTTPSIAMAFTPSAILVGGSSTLTFTITNANVVALSGLSFSDTLPAGLVVSTPNSLTDACGGTATATAGSNSISLATGAIAGSSSCVISVSVTGTTTGIKSNSVTVSDTAAGTGNTSNISITVNQAPAITSANATSFRVGTAGTFSVTSTGYPTAALTVTGLLPSGVTFVDNVNGTATLSGTAAANTGGVYPIVITANNGVAPNATQNFTLTVNQAPAITSANATSFTVGTAGSFTVTSTGAPTAALSETGALSTGVTFVDNGNGTATLSGTPTAAGPFLLTITAANGVLPNATQSFTLTVNQAAQIISFGANPGPLTYTPGGTFAVSATGGASGNPVTFASSTAAVCTVSGSTVSMVSAGLCTITANQLGNVNYAPATPVSQNITISQAAQTIVFTSTPPTVVAAGGATYTVAATGGASGNAVLFTVDASSTGICSIPPLGSTVSFLKSGTCIVDANQQGNGSYATAPQVQQTILVQNGVGPTVAAIAGFLSDRNNAIVTNMWNMDSTIDRLNDAPGGGGPGTGLADQPAGQPQTTLRSGLLANQNSSQSGTVIPALTSPASGAGMQDFLGLQQMVYGALRQLGETQGVNQLNYSGPFSAQMSTSGDMTGSFHTSLSQIMKWNDQAQQKEAASMGLKTSGAAGAHQFNPLDVWMQGTYAAINSTQQAKFGLISSGVDYVFNRNLLLGFYGQVDFMNQTTGLQAGGTGWLVGPYGTMRLTDQIFFEARGGYGHSANAMTDALDPTLTDQFGSTRWLASAALAGRWNFGDHISFKPNFGFTYFTDTTDAYVNGLSVAIPSVTSQLGQLKFSPEVTKGFSLGDANWYEASIAPELIYNFTSTTADGLGAVDPTATGPQGLRGAIKWGVSMKTPKGITIATEGSYDGIGASGYSAITGEARVNVPLN